MAAPPCARGVRALDAIWTPWYGARVKRDPSTPPPLAPSRVPLRSYRLSIGPPPRAVPGRQGAGMISSHRGFLIAFAGLFVALLGAGPARVARIVDVRVGVHADHTRIVIELDSSERSPVERPEAQGDEALTVHVDARAERRRIVSRSPLVEAVTLEPSDGGTLARIALRETGLGCTQMLLDAPPRIVIDVRRPAVAAALALAGEAAAAPPVAPPAALGQAAVRRSTTSFVPPASYRALVEAQQAAAAAAVPIAPTAPETWSAEDPPPVAAAAASCRGRVQIRPS